MTDGAAAPAGLDFRRACGRFATGVTVVTSRADDGAPIGITVNSFSSVSLQPPLVLFCLASRSRAYGAFEPGRAFAVHVLRHDQRGLAERFATATSDRFRDVPWRAGVRGAPILEAFTALFECTTMSTTPAGDHGVFIGRVDRVEVRDPISPLVFHGGAYLPLGTDESEPAYVNPDELWGLGWA
jgi:flavin reductase (DIM6/NTAB) family NADH-FMN oxidoreductase RutF